MSKIEKWVQKKQIVEGFSFSKSLLFGLSTFFKAAVSIRHVLYQLKVFKAVDVGVPILSVGNIVCGGTGKTEFVAKLVQDLKRDDLAILTGGYRSKRKGGVSLVQDVEDGDEPFMLADRLKKSWVIRGKRREKGAILAKSLKSMGCILDDGMQYLRIKKDVEVVMILASNPFSKGFVPFGMRRELLKKLQDIDYICIHGAKSQSSYELVKKEVLCYCTPKFFGTNYRLKENQALAGKKVGVFCGIGNPQAFIDGLKGLNVIIVKSKILADHEKCNTIVDFARLCQDLGAETLVCTEKDYVKLSSQEKKFVIPIQISMEVDFDGDIYHLLLDEFNALVEDYKKQTKEKL